MRIRNRTIFLFLFIFLAFLSPSTTLANEQWIRVNSQNFQLIGNAAEKDIRNVAAKLEQFREVFRQLFSNINLNSPIPNTVIVFKDEQSLSAFKPLSAEGTTRDFVKGYFQNGEAVNYIVLSAESGKANPYRVIFHEYTHFLVNNNFGRSKVPAWVNEGLAEYYEHFQIEDDRKVTLGSYDKEYWRFLQQNNLIPFEAFFNTDYYSLQRLEKEGSRLFYAQAGALVHYFMHGNNGARNGDLFKFLDLILKDKKPREAFAEAFKTDFASFEQEIKKYIEQRDYRSTVINLKSKLSFDNSMQVSAVSEIEVKATLGDLLYHINRLTEATALLEEALRLDANSVSANSTLGLVKMRQNNFPEAKKYLEKAIRLDEKNYLVHFLHAYVLSREGMTDYGFASGYESNQADTMRRSLKKAISLNPNFAESYNLYAYISVVRNEEIEEAIRYIKKALEIAPGNQWYLMRKAELFMQNKDFVNARPLAREVYLSASDDSLRLYARNLIGLINSYEAQLEGLKNPKKDTDVPNRELSEEELAILREKKSLEALNETIRRPMPDEKRILGSLTKVECKEKEISYFVKTDNENLLLSSENLNSVALINFDALMRNVTLGCGSLKENQAVIIYRPVNNATGKSVGEIVSVEFVPKNFKFLN
jgi:tetratricopeptide (TPR) repeat protein